MVDVRKTPGSTEHSAKHLTRKVVLETVLPSAALHYMDDSMYKRRPPGIVKIGSHEDHQLHFYGTGEHRNLFVSMRLSLMTC